MKYLLVLFSACLLLACGDDDPTINPGPDPDPDPSFNIWTGPVITFEKADGASPALPESRDSLTENVILTRGNNGGQIYNAVIEVQADKNESPRGTLWALGTTDDIENLEFRTFRSTVQPQEVVGKDMVLNLVADSVYLDIKFTSWSMGKLGGFAYERATPE